MDENMSPDGVRRAVAILWCLLIASATSWAQVADTASIGGAVHDASGAVLPGVTVEASSPALIDKVRIVVTDEHGLYRIVDLRPGVYVVTFVLPGFSTLKRDGLELTTGFTATVNADLKVGGIEETITVSGETPVVDIQSSRQQTTLARSTLDALPTAGRLAQYANLIPGAALGNPTWQSVGGLSEGGGFGIHGSRWGDNQPVQDGMVQRLQGGAIFIFNNLTFQEVIVETGGISAERNTGGVQMNIVTKDGGNTFSGTFSTSHSWPDLQRDNLNDKLRARGLTFAPSLKKHYDTGAAFGGPIQRNKLWFFGATRFAVNQQYQQGNYFNKLQNQRVGTDPVWRVTFYEPDLSRPAATDDFYRDYSLRLTWQAATKHKIVASYQVQPNCSCFWPLLDAALGGNPLAAPEATGRHNYLVNYLPLVTWTYPATNRLLIEAGVSANVLDNHTKRQQGVGTDTIGITDLAFNLRYGARALNLSQAGGYRIQHNRQYHQRLSMSYITGPHALKTGIDVNEYVEGVPGRANDPDQINGARSYVFNNRVPQQVAIWAVPFEALGRSREIGAYLQDQWTIRTLTFNLGLRFNNFNGYAPATHLPAGPFVPARDLQATKSSPRWNNLNPRLGAAYDLFGNGKTAIKVSLGRYNPYQQFVMGAIGGSVDVPLSNQAASTTRTWNDSFYGAGDPRTGNYVPDCDLLNPAVNGECGAWNDLTFGQIRTGNTRLAQDALSGFNQQDYNWQASVSVQHELRSNVALNVGYFRTTYGGFLVTDNQALTPASFDSFCVTAPRDSRLPGGGGNQICGLYDIKPTAFGSVNNLVTQAKNYGKLSEVFNGVDVTLTARFARGAQVGGGLSTGQTVTDTCAFNNLPQVLPTAIGGTATSTTILTPRLPGFCHISRPWTAATQLKFLAIYPLPLDFQVSTIYINNPGIPIIASRAFANAEVRPSLDRDLGQCRGAPTCTGTLTIDMVPPNTVFEDRVNLVDLRLTRTFRLTRIRVRGNADVYNLFNASDVLNMTTRFSGTTGGQWLQPIQILGGRMFKFSGQLDF
jgi:carboxypeptidase family protein